jgi:hypothetical protein
LKARIAIRALSWAPIPGPKAEQPSAGPLVEQEEFRVKEDMPEKTYIVSLEKLQELDALYEARSANRRPTDWGALVEKLREIRRAVEAGFVVQIEGGPQLRSWSSFYTWAHGRYHMLEDGYDKWIGDDR